MYRNITNVWHDLGHRNSNRMFKEILRIPANHSVSSLHDTDTQNTDSNAVWNVCLNGGHLRWFKRKKYQEEEACGKRRNNNDNDGGGGDDDNNNNFMARVTIMQWCYSKTGCNGHMYTELCRVLLVCTSSRYNLESQQLCGTCICDSIEPVWWLVLIS